MILSDCSAAIHAVQAHLHRPHERGYHHHRALLSTEICDVLRARDAEGMATIVRKVRAHAGIKGNELADWHAKFAACNQASTIEFPVLRHTLRAVPDRPEFWLHYNPDDRPPDGALAQDQTGEAQPSPQCPPTERSTRDDCSGAGQKSPRDPSHLDAMTPRSASRRGRTTVPQQRMLGLRPRRKKGPRGRRTSRCSGGIDPRKQVRARARPFVADRDAGSSLYVKRLMDEAYARGDTIEETYAGIAALRQKGRHGDAASRKHVQVPLGPAVQQ